MDNVARTGLTGKRYTTKSIFLLVDGGYGEKKENIRQVMRLDNSMQRIFKVKVSDLNLNVDRERERELFLVSYF